MKNFPIFLDLAGKAALVVGAGSLADSKVRLLAGAGSEVVQILPPGNAGPGKNRKSNHRTIRRPFRAADVRGKAVVISASGDPRLDREVAKAAGKWNIPVNVVDNPQLSSFIMPAIVDRDPVLVAISTGGAAPLLARRIRRRIERLLPPALARISRVAGDFRETVKSRFPEFQARKNFWEDFFSPASLSRLEKTEEPGIRTELLRRANLGPSEAPAGRVLLVGAGPGDPELLTLRGHRALNEADVIIHDRLVGAGVLDLARRDAERIDVGKEPGGGGYSQKDINALLVKHARQGQLVVRLKGGDPSVFGRAGEELEALHAAGIGVEIVPGVTSASAAAAAAGVSLTHRDHASFVTLATGHLKDGTSQNWRGLAGPGRSLAIYMGLGTARQTVAALIRDGFDRSTPVALVENASRRSERRLYAILGELPRLIESQRIRGPALILVGAVVALAPEYSVAPQMQEPVAEPGAVAVRGVR